MKQHTILILVLILMIPFLINSCSDKNKVREKRVSNSYVNWMSYKYMKCLHNDLPCNCESLNKYFLVSTDTANKTVLFYKAESHYEYNLFKLKQLSLNSYEVEQVNGDTITIVGKLKTYKDTLTFIEKDTKQITTFHKFGNGDIIFDFYKEYINLINNELSKRGYPSLNKTLHADTLYCSCNWEFGGINLVWKDNRSWIIEKLNNNLYIYEITNMPNQRIIDLKLEKKLLIKYKWQ